MLPEDDRTIETCRRVLSVLMYMSTCCHSTKLIQRSKSFSVLNCNCSNEQSMLPEDDRMIETCRSVLSVLMQNLDY